MRCWTAVTVCGIIIPVTRWWWRIIRLSNRYCRRKAARCFPAGNWPAPRTTGGVPGFRFVLYHAVGKEYGILPAFRPDYMLLTAGNRTYTYQDITVAVSPKSAGAGRQALLPAQVLAKME